MKPTVSTFCVVVLACTLLVSTAQGVQEIVFDITAVRHYDTPFSDFVRNSTLFNATDLLKTNDFSTCNPGDVSCCVTLSPSGSVSVFGGPGDMFDVIDTVTKHDYVFALSPEYKVVTAIEVCNGTSSSGGFKGCSKNPTAVRSALIRNNVSPDVWVHEFGHGQGQSDDNNCPAYIMNISASNTNVVTSAHCTKFRTLKQPYHLGGTCGGSSPPSAAS